MVIKSMIVLRTGIEAEAVTIPPIFWHTNCICIGEQGIRGMKAKTFILNILVEFLVLFGICIGFLCEVLVDSVRGFLKRMRKSFAFSEMELSTPSKE